MVSLKCSRYNPYNISSSVTASKLLMFTYTDRFPPVCLDLSIPLRSKRDGRRGEHILGVGYSGGVRWRLRVFKVLVLRTFGGP